MASWYKAFGPALLDDDTYNALSMPEMAVAWHIWNLASARPTPGRFSSRGLLDRLVAQRFGPAADGIIDGLIQMGWLEASGEALDVAAFVDMSATPDRRYDPTAADRQRRWREGQRYVTSHSVTPLDVAATPASAPSGQPAASELPSFPGERRAEQRRVRTLRNATVPEADDEWDVRDTIFDLTRARPWGVEMGKKAMDLEAEFGFADTDATMRRLKGEKPGLSAWELIREAAAALAKDREKIKEKEQAALHEARRAAMLAAVVPEPQPTAEQIEEGKKAWASLKGQLPGGSSGQAKGRA